MAHKERVSFCWMEPVVMKMDSSGWRHLVMMRP